MWSRPSDLLIIRVIRAIRGKIFAKMSDSDGLQCKERKDKSLCRFFFAIFVLFCGQSIFDCGGPRWEIRSELQIIVSGRQGVGSSHCHIWLF